jgi:enoyl-CoA hydratase/carnithine racemase
MEPVLIERRGAVALITLNRPDRLNALTEPMEELYYDLLEQADQDPEVRAIVVTGAGRGFCAGADIEYLSGLGDTGYQPASRPKTFPLTIRKPIIAAINGAAIGIGLIVPALYADIRIASVDAKLSTMFARRGLTAEHGISTWLPRIVGLATALDLLLSGRVVTGAEAAEIGLVHQAVPAEDVLTEALAYATDLADNASPWSMATIKRQVLDHLELDAEAALVESDAVMVECHGLAHMAEGVAAFVERRPPRFAPLEPRAGA